MNDGEKPVRRRSTREEFQILAARIQAALQFQGIYPPRHPQVEQSITECYAELVSSLEQAPKIQIALAGDEFILGSIQVPIEGELLEGFAKTLNDVGVQKLVFRSGLREWELRRFLTLVADGPEQLRATGGLKEAVSTYGIEHIEATSITLDLGGSDDPELLFRTWEAYSTGLKIVRSLRTRARQTGVLEGIDEARDFVDELVRVAIENTRPLLAVESLKTHDDYSFTHSVNVAMLTMAMACSLPFEKNDLHDIGVAALLHDVGKERIPLEILNKPGKLTPEEWDVVNRHGSDGARMLADTEGVPDLAPIVAFEHHLAYHPELREGIEWRPHLVSQIVTLADVYDALRTIRPYRGELPPDEAMRIMEGDVGKKFDPDLFEGFAGMFGYYPPGTCVRLDNGALGMAYASNPADVKRPHILLLRDPAGRMIEPPAPVDLCDTEDQEVVSLGGVAEVVDAKTAGIEPLNYF